MEVAQKLSLVESFSRYFRVSLAETVAQKQQVFRIRYRVYCEEFKYESQYHFTDQLEVDEYDR